MAPLPRTSLWAIASIVCAVVSCPPMCLIAIVLGLVGLVQVKVRPDVTGRGLALAGIGLGLITTAAWGAAFGWWHVNVRRPIIEGPRAALVAGLDGDVEAFRAAFHEPAPADETAVFLGRVADRYGSFVDMTQDPTPLENAGPGRLDRERPVVRYRLRFVRGTPASEAQFVRTDGAQWPMVLRWGWLRIRDADRGDLTYPASAPDSR